MPPAASVAARAPLRVRPVLTRRVRQARALAPLPGVRADPPRAARSRPAPCRGRRAPPKEIHVRLKDVQVASRSLEIATVVATITRELSDGVTSVAETGALTLVVHRDPDGWRIVTEHYSNQHQ